MDFFKFVSFVYCSVVLKVSLKGLTDPIVFFIQFLHNIC